MKSALLAPVPLPPFTVRTPQRDCYRDIADERRAASLAIRLVRHGVQLVEMVDATGWKCGIYARAEPR